MENSKNKITIIGAGGSGSWIGLFSAISGVKEITIFDGDEIDERDLNNKCAFKQNDKGKNKADALAEIINSFNPNTIVNSMPRYFDIEKDKDMLVDGTFISCDDAKLIAKISGHCKSKGYKHVIPPYARQNAAVFKEFRPSIKINSGYGPAWMGSCAMAGLLACTSLFSTNFEIIFDIEKAMCKNDCYTDTEIKNLMSDGNM